MNTENDNSLEQTAPAAPYYHSVYTPKQQRVLGALIVFFITVTFILATAAFVKAVFFKTDAELLNQLIETGNREMRTAVDSALHLIYRNQLTIDDIKKQLDKK
jgi:hypothetical protein